MRELSIHLLNLDRNYDTPILGIGISLSFTKKEGNFITAFSWRSLFTTIVEMHFQRQDHSIPQIEIRGGERLSRFRMVSPQWPFHI